MAAQINVTRSSMPEYEEYTEEIRDLWDSHWLTNMGSKHVQLQRELEQYLDVEHIDLLTNGHMALELSLQAYELKGEVITTPFTFVSTTHAIVRNGLKPVFCDVNPVDFTMDTEKLESLITENTCAIMPVHVYGNICNVDEIERIAKKYNIPVIYDAAHTFGVKYKGRGIGSYGDISCFSFHATKVFNTVEGGAVCFNEAHKEIGDKIARLKDFGIVDAEETDLVGPNAKMNEFCAAMGLCNLRHVDREIAKRKAVNDRYRMHLEGVEGLQLNPVQKDVTPNYAYFPVFFDEKVFGASRDDVFAKLAENKIGARKYFYPITTAFACYKDIYDPEETPVALKLSHQVMTVPMYADLALEDVDRICEIILSCRK